MGMSDIKGARGLGCNIVAIAKQHTAVCLAAATLRAMNLKSARRTRTFTQSHHDLINKSCMQGGYADTPGNGPT